MILSEKLQDELQKISNEIEKIMLNKSLTGVQIENFLKLFEKRRYNILKEIKMYNKNEININEKIKSIDNEYKAELVDGIIKIYIPETMPSFKNLKTHTYKRILLNVSEVTKKFKNTFDGQVFIFIKVFDDILGWDIDNKCIKPIADALISSEVIKDDNISKMFYAVKGEKNNNPHTEVWVLDSKKINDFFKKYSI